MSRKKNIASLLFFAIVAIAVIGFVVYAFVQIDKSDNNKVNNEIDFAQLYSDFQDNPISAKEIYQDNRYILTGEIVKIDKAGLTEAFVGYNVDMKIIVNDTPVCIYGNFNRKDDIINLGVGDILTFSGECVSDSIWYECEVENVEEKQ